MTCARAVLRVFVVGYRLAFVVLLIVIWFVVDCCGLGFGFGVVRGWGVVFWFASMFCILGWCLCVGFAFYWCCACGRFGGW